MPFSWQHNTAICGEGALGELHTGEDTGETWVSLKRSAQPLSDSSAGPLEPESASRLSAPQVQGGIIQSWQSITETMDPESQAGQDGENMADGPRYIRKTPERQDVSLLLIQPQSQNHAQYRAVNSYSRCPVKAHWKNELKKIRGPNNVDKWLTGIIEELSMKNRRLWSKKERKYFHSWHFSDKKNFLLLPFSH